MSLRVFLVDDERLARQAMRRMLSAHDDVEIVGEADSAAAALNQLKAISADLVLLDVEMPGGSGFDVVTQLSGAADVIFVTAWDHYAAKAFDVEALDYVVKPVDPERLRRALQRARQRRAERGDSDGRLRLDQLLCLPVHNGVRFFRVRDIGWITAADDYSELHLFDGTALLSTTPLKGWEARLPEDYARIHRSTIALIAAAEQVMRGQGDAWEVRLKGVREPLAMSRRYAAALQDRLGLASR